MRAILVPLDGSALAETALPTALALARRSPGTRLDAVVVLATPPAAIPAAGAPVTDRRFDHDLYAETEQYAATMRQRLAALAPDLTPALTLLYGDPAERIAHFAREGDYDVIVMTTHGRTGLSRAWLGSVADGVLRLSHVPVLLLRDAAAATPREGEGVPLYADVIVPFDDGRVSEEILPDAVAVAGTSARFHLIHVVVPPRWLPPPSALEIVTAGESLAPDPGDLYQGRDAALRRLEGIAEQLRARGLEVHVHVPVHANPAEAILECARERHASLIAMTTHGRRTPGRLLLGSVADKVVRGAATPVLVRVPATP